MKTPQKTTHRRSTEAPSHDNPTPGNYTACGKGIEFRHLVIADEPTCKVCNPKARKS